jgi:uncharacterized membrane protein YedE/YeeE
MNKKIAFLCFGVVFGFALSRVGASDYNLIYRMFTGEDLKLAFVIGSAIITAAIGMKVLMALGGKTIDKQPIKISKKALSKNNAIGGALFGIGWGISGACPGTVLAQIGEGKLLGIASLLGMVAGTYLFAVLAEKNKSLS